MQANKLTFEKVYGKIIWVFSFFILLLFVWFSLVSTSTVSMMEKVFFTDISGIPYLIVAVILFAITLIPPVNKLIRSLDKKLDDDKYLFRILYYLLVALLLLMGIVWVFVTDFMSWSDSAYLQTASTELITGDYSAFLSPGYVGRWQNQIGLALIEASMIRFFGDRSNTFFQLINVLCIPVIVTSLSRFTGSKLRKLIIMLTGLLWLPLLLSVSHVYGNVPGLMLSLLAYVYLLDHLEKGKTGTGLLSAFLIAFACLVKQNYFIFLIAYILICIINSVKKKKIVYAAVAACAVLMSILFTKSAVEITERITGFEIEGGVSKWSYIAMAMQEGDRAPGWYNGYNTNSYDMAGCDTSVQSELAKTEIRKRISEFSEQPSYMIGFYTKKLASQWNEPTFQTIWYLRGPGKDLPGCIEYMVSIYGSYKMVPYFKFFEVVIYLSAFLFICFEKKADDKTLLLLTTFIGGVMFHLIWEAKAQYALFYFVLLIPVAVSGCASFRSAVNEMIRVRTQKEGNAAEEKKSSGKLRVDLIVCFVLFLLFLGGLYYLHVPGSLKEGTVSYYEYIVENSIQN